MGSHESARVCVCVCVVCVCAHERERERESTKNTYEGRRCCWKCHPLCLEGEGLTRSKRLQNTKASECQENCQTAVPQLREQDKPILTLRDDKTTVESLAGTGGRSVNTLQRCRVKTQAR